VRDVFRNRWIVGQRELTQRHLLSALSVPATERLTGTPDKVKKPDAFSASERSIPKDGLSSGQLPSRVRWEKDDRKEYSN
jgi:hypothetical protein